VTIILSGSFNDDSSPYFCCFLGFLFCLKVDGGSVVVMSDELAHGGLGLENVHHWAAGKDVVSAIMDISHREEGGMVLLIAALQTRGVPIADPVFSSTPLMFSPRSESSVNLLAHCNDNTYAALQPNGYKGNSCTATVLVKNGKVVGLFSSMLDAVTQTKWSWYVVSKNVVEGRLVGMQNDSLHFGKQHIDGVPLCVGDVYPVEHIPVGQHCGSYTVFSI